ncbi:hypothetical protein JCM11491_000588 [Sporobolomyces phaffii]
MSTLFYGVFVKAASLCFAADAYDAEHRTLLAIDLIRSRSRNGRLACVSSTSPIARVPDELWSLVEQQLVDQATRRAERLQIQYYSSRFPCLKCYWQEAMPKRCAWEHWSKCPEFLDAFWETDGLLGMLKQCSEKIESLLQAFGIDLPLDFYHLPETTRDKLDFDALEALGISVRSTDASGRASIVDALWADRRATARKAAHSIVQVSQSTLSVSSDGAAHLQRFISLFNLAIENPSSSTLCASSPRPLSTHAALADPSTTPTNANSKELQSESDHKRVCCSNPRTAPHWWLVTTLADVSCDDE